MRIAFVVDTAGPFYFGGYEKRAFELARRLARKHVVTMLTSAPKPRVIDGVRYVPLRPNVNTFNLNGYRSTQEALRFSLAVTTYAVRRHAYDIVDCNATPYLHIPSAWILARRSGARLVLTVHEALLDQLGPYFADRGVRLVSPFLSLARSSYRGVHALADCVVACSDITHQRLEEEGVRPDGITHGGVESIGSPRQTYGGHLVCIARLVPPKRVRAVVQAFGIAHSRGHARRLTIIGDGPERENLAALASHQGLAEHIDILTGMNEQSKHLALAETDLSVSASLREGLSIATLECLGAGLPAVISSRPDQSVNGALEYLVDGSNGLVTDGTPEALAEAMGRVALDEKLFRRLSEGAIATARRYTWDEAARELESVYRRALGAPERRPSASVAFR